MKLLRLSFIPTSIDFSLLLLRLWLGLSMLLLHGWGKLLGFSANYANFPDPLGIGSKASLALVVFSEFACSALLIVGFLTRFAALSLSITMGVAFFIQHRSVLAGEGNGELAFIYLAGFITLFFAGSGKFAFEKD
ncbi:MAG: DoxX family protein [Bdellovibrionales bacterium]|nr:DoxX family protein [Bdellovibrionales bacterium]